MFNYELLKSNIDFDVKQKKTKGNTRTRISTYILKHTTSKLYDRLSF